MTRTTAFARTTVPIATTGNVFGDGTFLEPIRDPADPERIALLYWDGAEATVGPRVECRGRIYEPAPIDPTMLRAMTLPAGIAPSGSARQLLHEIGQEITRYSALPERFATETSWFTLSTGFPDATPSASRLVILNPETIAANQLFTLLGALCGRALPFSMLTLSQIAVARQRRRKRPVQMLFVADREPSHARVCFAIARIVNRKNLVIAGGGNVKNVSVFIVH